MKGFKYISWLLVMGFLVGCGSQAPKPNLAKPKPDDYYDQKNREDENRRSSLDRARKRYTGPKCEGDSQCEEYCKDIYNRRSVREDCLELARAQVDKLWEIYEIFENPKNDDLEIIDPDDFKVFVEIDLRPLDVLIGKFSGSEAKRVLAWIAEESDISEVFQDEDDEYRLLEELLREIDTDQKQALSKNLSGGDSFIEIALADEGSALDWIHNFISEECDSSSKEEVCILQDWYCHLELKDDQWDNLVGYENFALIIDDILEDYQVDGATTSDPDPDWWKLDEEIEARDLDVTGGDNELEDLCDKNNY